jgi:hypothetical protein
MEQVMTGTRSSSGTDAPRHRLLPCPFCGGEAKVERQGTARQSSIIACEDCGCRVETGEIWSIGDRWNTRHVAQPPIDPTNHHNALLCPYCNPDGLKFASPPSPVAGEWQPIAAALARRLCQIFDFGGESQRTVRARHASAIFQLLDSDAPEFLVEQRRCDADPFGYLQAAEGLALSSTDKSGAT